jgi:hypothetical protein
MKRWRGLNAQRVGSGPVLRRLTVCEVLFAFGLLAIIIGGLLALGCGRGGNAHGYGSSLPACPTVMPAVTEEGCPALGQLCVEFSTGLHPKAYKPAPHGEPRVCCDAAGECFYGCPVPSGPSR